MLPGAKTLPRYPTQYKVEDTIYSLLIYVIIRCNIETVLNTYPPVQCFSKLI
jgi:hypothetical protein